MKHQLSIFAAVDSLWAILSPEQQRAAVSLIGLMLFGTVLEMLGIGLVLPVIMLIAQDNPGANYPFLSSWIQWIGNPPKNILVVVGVLSLLGIYSLRTIFLAFLVWKQSKFIYWLQASWAQQLFNGYLWQPYSFHLMRNSAQLIRNVMSQVGSLVGSVQQGLLLLTELLVLLSFSICLFWVEPVGVLLIVGIMGGAALGFNRLTYKRVHRWGEALQGHESKRIQHLQEALGGAKDIKLLGREREFIASFENHNIKSANILEKQTTMVALPRLWLEFLAVAGIVMLVLIMVWQGKPMEALLPTLGVFGAAAFRLVPSVNRVIGAIQNTRFAVPVVENLTRELNLLSQRPADLPLLPFVFLQDLIISGVSFRYEGGSSDALKDIDIRIPKGSTVGFIGGSGAGKSTLVDIILGLLQPKTGKVYADGVDIKENLRGWQTKIGYVPQNIYLNDNTIRRNIAFGIAEDQINDTAVIQAVNAAQLNGFIASLPMGLNTIVGERGVRFSGGQRQRIGIARALYHNPEILVLDEATSSLDHETETAVMDSIVRLKREKTIIVVAHRLTTVEACDWIYKLNDGEVVQQGSAHVILNGLLQKNIS